MRCPQSRDHGRYFLVWQVIVQSRAVLTSAANDASASNIVRTLVKGRVVVDRGAIVSSDQERVLRQGSEAIQRVWRKTILGGCV